MCHDTLLGILPVRMYLNAVFSVSPTCVMYTQMTHFFRCFTQKQANA